MKTLCAWCGKMEKVGERWVPLRDPPSPEERVSHGICPACEAKMAEENPMPSVPHGTFRRIRRAVARRPDVTDPSALAAWIKREYYGNPPLLHVKAGVVSPTTTEVEHGDATILFSYETPVAVFVAGQGVFITDKFWSRTTSTHIGKWINQQFGAGVTRTKLPQEIIERIAQTGGQQTAVARNPTLAILGNPGRRRKIAKRVLAIDYVHASDGKKYTHDFGEDKDHGPVCAYVEDGGRRVVLEASDGRAIVKDY